ncbi:hypothetical protein IFM89_025269 [Coptis chinensis]|uniref:Uncharacterized protein n=1 Tax=Coptis chinensis TaxID=261450 RepID=A0A835GZQ8_9MAGN|nr:hypothetical protein IFM89_025269 [Coptis chinensis]
MVNRVEEENSEEGLGIGNFVDVAYGMHEELVGDLSGGNGSQAEDVEPPIVLEPNLGYLIMAPGQSQPIASQPSSLVPLPSHNSTSDSHTSQPLGNSPMITKFPIEFNEDGIVVGPNHAKWNTQDKEDPSRKHGWVDSWKKGHEHRDGPILASARTHYEQVEASHKRRKEASAGGEGSVMEVDFDNDELSEVFGPDKGSRTSWN